MKNTAADKTSVREKLLLCLGLAFFCNPVLGLVDVLPDAFGALMVFFALTRYAYINEGFENARRISVWLIAAESLKLAVTFPITSGGSSSDILAATAICVAVEAIFFILFFRAFFASCDETAILRDMPLTLERCTPASFTTYIFLAVRFIADLVPQLYAIAEVDLNHPEVGDKADFLEELIKTRPVITAALLAAALITGAVAAVRLWRLGSALTSEASHLAAGRYSEAYGSNPEKRLFKRIRFALLIFCAAQVFTFDLAFDNKRVLPLAASFACFFACAFLLKKHVPCGKAHVFSSAAFLLAAAFEIYRYFFAVPDPVAVRETPLAVAGICSAFAAAVSVLGILALRDLLAALGYIASQLGVGFPAVSIYILWCLNAAAWAFQAVLPYFAPYLTLPRFALVAAMCFAVWRASGDAVNASRERVELGLPLLKEDSSAVSPE